MPDKTACPRCKKIGFVRLEHVVRGGQAWRQFFCGACEFFWEVAADGSGSRSADHAKSRPDRSRS